MTAPAITVGPHVTIHAAGRLMSTRHVRLMPVVDKDDRLIGVVSRRDLLAVFLRPDEDIAADVRRVLDEILLAEPGEAEVAVRDGIVTLIGTAGPQDRAHGDLIPVAVRLMWDVNGVVDIIDRLGQPLPVTHTESAPPARQAERGERPPLAGHSPLCPASPAWDEAGDEKQRPRQRSRDHGTERRER